MAWWGPGTSQCPVTNLSERPTGPPDIFDPSPLTDVSQIFQNVYNYVTHSGWDKMAVRCRLLFQILIFLCENYNILIQLSLKFVPKGSINNKPSLVQMMACHQPGDKQLSEPVMAKFTDICLTQSRWVQLCKLIMVWILWGPRAHIVIVVVPPGHTELSFLTSLSNADCSALFYVISPVARGFSPCSSSYV